jgi:hypothetical protein
MPNPLYTAPLSTLKHHFATAGLPSAAKRAGLWRARFIGPWWLRLGGRPGVALSGLRGWQGKRFLTPDHATNVLDSGEALSMQCRECPSSLDGGPVAALSYGADGPVPWRWVTDELRALDERTLLGMTVINLPLLRHFAFPFLLERDA